MIDSRAVIDPKAKLSSNVKVGPYTVIGPNTEIGDNTEIGSHVVITGKTKIGRNNKIYHFSSLGAEPQDMKYKGEETALEIGDNNVIREYCSLHRGTAGPNKGITKIGNNNFLMAYVHIAHDCKVGNEVIFANNTGLAGHVAVEDYAVFGGFAVVAQFLVIGAYSFVAGTTGINKDVLPYTLVSSYHGPAKSYGLNSIGLRRRGFSVEKIIQLKRAYRAIYKEPKVKQVIPKLEAMLPKCPEIQLFIDMIAKSQHGVIR